MTDPTGHDPWWTPDEMRHEAANFTQMFARQIQAQVASGLSAVEGFGKIMDKAWELTHQNLDDLMWVLSNVILGVNPSVNSLWARQINEHVGDRATFLRDWGILYNPRENPYFVGYDLLPATDWIGLFQDGSNNQVFHFFYYAALSYYSGSAVTAFGVAAHDPPAGSSMPCLPAFCTGGVSDADFWLGAAGNSYGSWLREARQNNEALAVSPGAVLRAMLATGAAKVTGGDGSTRQVGVIGN